MKPAVIPFNLVVKHEDTRSYTTPEETPPQQPLIQLALTTTSYSMFHPVIFEKLNGILIRSVAIRVQGAAGPAGLDSAFWRRMCTVFHDESDQLCEAIAKLAIHINTSFIDPDGLTSFVACQLIALDKCPGVRPIGVGEVLRRIVCKATLNLVWKDVQDAVGSLQLCVGHDSGCEAAVHALRTIFEDKESEAVLLRDASNAFNSLNRSNALHNIMNICPSLATIAINSYRQHPQLFIDNEKLLSQEGTTQGDPLAMAIYANGFTLHKSAFRDAVCLRYVKHSLSCPTGGFPIIRHNEIRDITASQMTEVCHSVSVKPLLQPLTGEQLSTKSAVTTDEARADIQARGFRGDRKQQPFFDVKVFNLYAKATVTPLWPTVTENAN